MAHWLQWCSSWQCCLSRSNTSLKWQVVSTSSRPTQRNSSPRNLKSYWSKAALSCLASKSMTNKMNHSGMNRSYRLASWPTRRNGMKKPKIIHSFFQRELLTSAQRCFILKMSNGQKGSTLTGITSLRQVLISTNVLIIFQTTSSEATGLVACLSGHSSSWHCVTLRPHKCPATKTRL